MDNLEEAAKIVMAQLTKELSGQMVKANAVKGHTMQQFSVDLASPISKKKLRAASINLAAAVKASGLRVCIALEPPPEHKCFIETRAEDGLSVRVIEALFYDPLKVSAPRPIMRCDIRVGEPA